jgi:hypothetical protein
MATMRKPGGREPLRRSDLQRKKVVERLVVDPEAVQPAGRDEIYPFFALGVILGFIALLVCYRKNYLLLYGDAVAHLGIARRILDARYPGLSQLGGVWLPLPHVLMLPFIGKMAMWQTGFAAVPMSLLSYAFSVAGMWRLARRLMRARWALVATAFFALNANLLYLSTTAMTEALFLALVIWTVVAAMECVAALRAGQVGTARARMLLAGVLIMGQVFTRYDGWVMGAAVWVVIAVACWRSPVRDRMRVGFGVFTLLCVAGPLLWFWFNAHFEGDWLDFMRGPYSAKAIEQRTAPPGQHYRGWHQPGWALLFYLRTAQVDAAAWETGFGLMAAALYGTWRQCWKPGSESPPPHPTEQLRSAGTPDPGHPSGDGTKDWAKDWIRDTRFGARVALLLWVPLPFYVYSMAWGSVPIFIPQLWPHSYYNARYGMGLLPALAVYGALAAERLDVWMRGKTVAWAKIGARFWQPVAMLLCVANCIAMMYFIPAVLKEGMVNAVTRQAFEKQLAVTLMEFPADEPVMMSTSAHIGAVQLAGRTLKSMVTEGDRDSWERALVDPAHSAAVVIAMKDGPVAAAVKAHPQGLKEVEVICTTGQPCATVYQSEVASTATAP